MIALGSRHTIILCKNGYVYAFGSNSHNQCDFDEIDQGSVESIAAGS